LYVLLNYWRHTVSKGGRMAPYPTELGFSSLSSSISNEKNNET